VIKILDMNEATAEEIFDRGQSETAAQVEAAVADILKNVRLHGDEAVLEYTEKFDGVRV
jgi:histidinol dehydrogenase